MKEILNVKARINKANKQINFSLPKKQISKDIIAKIIKSKKMNIIIVNKKGGKK